MSTPHPLRLLHFADAHIDLVTYGRRDPQTGLPLRVLDFLRALDTIIDTAIAEQVDLVLFAGDAFKDRRPAPVYFRAWAQRILRLSQAGIPTVLLVGNHDYTPSLGHVHALSLFDLFAIPKVRVVDRPTLLGPADLWDLPLQILALPWLSPVRLLAELHTGEITGQALYEQLNVALQNWFAAQLEQADPHLPLVLLAHATVQGARYSTERMVMLGDDLVLPPSLVKNPRFAYVALGHIHKAQDLNAGQQPPVVYAGSIERMDFGEANDDKRFVLVEIAPGQPTRYTWHSLPGRPFVDRFVRLTEPEGITERLLQALGPAEDLADAVVRLVIEYPREWEPLIDERALRAHAEKALFFHLVKRPQSRPRLRLPADRSVESLTPEELLERYWLAQNRPAEEIETLKALARQIIQEVEAENAEGEES